MKLPLVCISIPTYNSARTLAVCLRALKEQTYKNIEVNIIDGRSSDNTLKIARKFGIKKVKEVSGFLLKARYEGVKLSRGKYFLMLDSDQVLANDSIARAVEMVKKEGFKMLAFEENVYKKESFLEKLFDLDRRLINGVNDLNPKTGVIMPRFFEFNLLRKAYTKIPKKLLSTTGGQDHAVIYKEVFQLSRQIGVLPKAVKHIEPSHLVSFLKKFYRWGYTSVDVHFGKYRRLIREKERFRTGLFTKGLFVESLGSILLLILKGVPYKLGLYKAVLDRKIMK